MTSALTTKQQCVLMAARDGEKIEDGTTRSVRMPAQLSRERARATTSNIKCQLPGRSARTHVDPATTMNIPYREMLSAASDGCMALEEYVSLEYVSRNDHN